jgi:tetratricopeptide (TPR) repeat protein
MKTKLFIFFFSLCVIPVFAQESEMSGLSNYLQKAQYQQAIEYIDQQEASKDLLYQKALCYKSLNDFSKAIEILEPLSEEYPEDIPVKLQLALCYESTLSYLKSVGCYEKLMQIDSTNVFFRVRKADLLYRAEKYPSALEEYFAINPEFNPGYLTKSLAMCYDKLNQPDSAKVYFSRAWEIEAKDSFSALSLVKIHLKQEDFQSALIESEKFISRDSTNIQMNILNAHTYYNLNRYEEAVERFEKCRLQGDSSLTVNKGLGISYYFLKNDSLAFPCLHQAYLQDTTNTNVLYAFASVNYNLGYYPDAIKYYADLVERATPNRNALFIYHKELGKSCEKNKMYADAVRIYHLAIPYITDNVKGMELYYALATLCENELKAYTEAINYYKQYRLSLFNYQGSLTDEKEIEEMELKINELDKHIRQLTINN